MNICEEHKGAVLYTLGVMTRRYNIDYVDRDDLVQIGYLALLSIKDKIDYSLHPGAIKGYIFRTIEFFMRDYLNRANIKCDNRALATISCGGDQEASADAAKLAEACSRLTERQQELIKTYKENNCKIEGSSNINHRYRNEVEVTLIALRRQIAPKSTRLEALEAVKNFTIVVCTQKTGWFDSELRDLCKKYSITPLKMRRRKRGIMAKELEEAKIFL